MLFVDITYKIQFQRRFNKQPDTFTPYSVWRGYSKVETRTETVSLDGTRTLVALSPFRKAAFFFRAFNILEHNRYESNIHRDKLLLTITQRREFTVTHMHMT